MFLKREPGSVRSALLYLAETAEKGGYGWKCQRNDSRNKASYSSNLKGDQGMKSLKIATEKGEKKGTFVFGGTRRFKNQKLLLDGVLCSSQEIFSRGFNEKRMSGCQRERIVSFQKGAEKKPLWSEIIHGVTVTP